MRRRQLSGPSASSTPALGEIRSAACSLGTSSRTTACEAYTRVETPRETYAARSSAGGVRGANRGPCGGFGVIRSARKVRQSSRSTSQATRYQRRSLHTRRCGSTVRRLEAPPWSLYSKRSRSASRQRLASSVRTPGSTAEGWGPRSMGTVKAFRAPTRRRSRLGRTCSSLARARTEVSPIPSMPCPAAVRRPTATATASSSSRSSGGSSAPAPSW
ncbi:hypothetical protein AQJ46_48590 [Streptomyces canus]|uniref:Uncharacterized protein n=1 Tax=Streptomyces canus TaxID=58343 RepID=A0A101RKR3_9ACTN|nr:hypothetical protein AQJ46_48590 [Streptomyces canus]